MSAEAWGKMQAVADEHGDVLLQVWEQSEEQSRAEWSTFLCMILSWTGSCAATLAFIIVFEFLGSGSTGGAGEPSSSVSSPFIVLAVGSFVCIAALGNWMFIAHMQQIGKTVWGLGARYLFVLRPEENCCSSCGCCCEGSSDHRSSSLSVEQITSVEMEPTVWSFCCGELEDAVAVYVPFGSSVADPMHLRIRGAGFGDDDGGRNRARIPHGNKLMIPTANPQAALRQLRAAREGQSASMLGGEMSGVVQDHHYNPDYNRAAAASAAPWPQAEYMYNYPKGAGGYDYNPKGAAGGGGPIGKSNGEGPYRPRALNVPKGKGSKGRQPSVARAGLEQKGWWGNAV
ncbi:unnamed protein product [Amoebophrya sp. A25]|nr:unnamed protein product [Amoebophrya sp. A25]|eukprot:GSA25T00022919001.1